MGLYCADSAVKVCVPFTAKCTSGDQHWTLADHEAGAARDNALTMVTDALAV